MGSYETVAVERREGVVTVTMNRPRRKNAVNPTMLAELTDAFDAAARDPDVRVLVLTGAEGEFCSGADLSEANALADGLTYMRRIADLALRLHRLPRPTIARVDGVAAGMGVNLAFGCDLIVSSDRARFSEIFARRGLSVACRGSLPPPRLGGCAAGHG